MPEGAAGLEAGCKEQEQKFITSAFFERGNIGAFLLSRFQASNLARPQRKRFFIGEKWLTDFGNHITAT